jgi:hypothetical protein
LTRLRFRGCVICHLQKAACPFCDYSVSYVGIFNLQNKHRSLKKTRSQNRKDTTINFNYSTMLGTSSALIRRGAPRIVKSVLAQSSKKTFPASASACVPFDAFYSDSEQNQHSTTTIRYFSAVPLEHTEIERYTVASTQERQPGSVTKTLRVLNMDVVKQIMEELRSVDVNSDGR